MHTRVTTLEATDINAVEAQLDGTSEEIAAIPGVIRMQAAWTGEGKGIVTAIYESQEAANAGRPTHWVSGPQSSPIWPGCRTPSSANAVG